jgi:hypothetical protein
MNDQISAALQSLGQVNVTSVLPAFEDAPTLIARGTVSKAEAAAIKAFKHSTLQFSFNGPASGSEQTYSFHVYFDPKDLAATEIKQSKQPSSSK